jgi:hypothetical protein
MVARHGKKVTIHSVTLILDTMSDPDWNVLRTETGYPVARQTKQTVGQRFRQGTNPDYDGYSAFALEYWDPHDEAWHVYNSDARKGELFNQTVLDRIAASYTPVG